jgi:hypothetical protein
MGNVSSTIIKWIGYFGEPPRFGELLLVMLNQEQARRLRLG